MSRANGPARPRHVALALVRVGDLFLVGEAYDAVKRERFYRPLGGEVEPGETPEQAAVRELREETGRLVELTRHIGTIDSRFVYEGRPGWEIVDVFEARFAEPIVDDVMIMEVGWQPAWIKLDSTDAPLYPDGLHDIVMSAPGTDTRSKVE